MRPQGLGDSAGGGASILSPEIQRIANENVQIRSRVTAVNVPVGTSSVEVNHLPSGMIGSVVRPQFMTGASIAGSEIQRIANEVMHEYSSVAVSRTAVDVDHLPS